MGGEPQGMGTQCTPDDIRDPGTYRLANHPDASKAPPPYGLRFDNLVPGEPGHYTFDFQAPGAEMFLDYDGVSIRIYGSAYGGKDIGNDYDPVLQGMAEIDMTYVQAKNAPGDDDLAVNEGDGNVGTITFMGVTYDMVEQADGDGFTFRFGDEDDDQGHRGFPGISGWGWFAGEGTRDWVFTAQDLCVETGACCLRGGDGGGDDDDGGGDDDGAGSGDDDDGGGNGGGGCVELTEELCIASGGSYQGDGSDCDRDPCPDAVGACCIGGGGGGDDDDGGIANDDGGGGSCEILNKGECESQGGEYQGDGSNCNKCDGGGDDDDGNQASAPPAGWVPDVRQIERVSVTDILTSWGPCPAFGDCDADLSQDDVVNLDDLMILIDSMNRR
jgi:hypothetical protein